MFTNTNGIHTDHCYYYIPFKTLNDVFLNGYLSFVTNVKYNNPSYVRSLDPGVCVLVNQYVQKQLRDYQKIGQYMNGVGDKLSARDPYDRWYHQPFLNQFYIQNPQNYRIDVSKNIGDLLINLKLFIEAVKQNKTYYGIVQYIVEKINQAVGNY